MSWQDILFITAEEASLSLVLSAEYDIPIYIIRESLGLYWIQFVLLHNRITYPGFIVPEIQIGSKWEKQKLNSHIVAHDECFISLWPSHLLVELHVGLA